MQKPKTGPVEVTLIPCRTNALSCHYYAQGYSHPVLCEERANRLGITGDSPKVLIHSERFEGGTKFICAGEGHEVVIHQEVVDSYEFLSVLCREITGSPGDVFYFKVL